MPWVHFRGIVTPVSTVFHVWHDTAEEHNTKGVVNRKLALRASLSGTFLQRKDVVNQCLEFAPNLCVLTSKQIKRTFAFSKQYTNYCMEKEGANM